MSRNGKMLKKQANDGTLDTLALNDPVMRLERNGQRSEQWVAMVLEARGRKNFKERKGRVNY